MTKITALTFGCSLNHADSEMMLGLLKQARFDIVEDPESADLIIINSCTVKHLAEKKLFRSIEEFKAKGKHIVVAGCVAQAHQEYLSSMLRDYSVIGTKQIANIVSIVNTTLDGNIIHALDINCDKRVCVPIVRRNPAIGIVPLAEGCVGDCSYCKTRQARGRLVSYSPGAIVQRVRTDVQQGCREIWLTSQDCGAYGQDIAENFVSLLKSVMKVEGDFKVRLGMSNPQHVLRYLPWLIEVFKEHAKPEGKLFNFIHIPVQSGDDLILKAMNRKYTVDEFRKIVTTLRNELPDITIATDVIVGFPGESDAQFQNSMKLVKDCQFDVINISRFWPRPGTRAASMPDQVHGQVSKVRSEQLKAVKDQMCAARNQFWKDWSGSIIIDEKGPTGGFIGRNYAYKPVAIQGNHSLGDVVEVKVTDTAAHHLGGAFNNA
ncbi:TPA: tRNA (N(6)-L-threonylcarbamoyladenosine(37)-C(2))-methylthiotransferase [Candidatus Woesearchaeota archaeon]|nr:tRNA (N(6)-L-threonylcarbamoyladenosine(37)-C(2))-methylthiotransferase [Candidatus Woesearchaeota archaeon]